MEQVKALKIPETIAWRGQRGDSATPPQMSPFYAICTVFIGGGGGLQFVDKTSPKHLCEINTEKL